LIGRSREHLRRHPGTGNTIAFNQLNGVEIEASTNNAIQGNSIFGNTGLGIDLNSDGPAPNQGTIGSADGLLVCRLGTVAVGGQATGVVTAQPSESGTFTSDCSVAGRELGFDPSNNRTQTSMMVGITDVSLSLVRTPDPAAAGQLVTCLPTLRNSGPDSATGLQGFDWLDPSYFEDVFVRDILTHSNLQVSVDVTGSNDGQFKSVIIIPDPAEAQRFYRLFGP
jgi:hypothetical protein